jgi:hypothetical protein
MLVAEPREVNVEASEVESSRVVRQPATMLMWGQEMLMWEQEILMWGQPPSAVRRAKLEGLFYLKRSQYS